MKTTNNTNEYIQGKFEDKSNIWFNNKSDVFSWHLVNSLILNDDTPSTPSYGEYTCFYISVS
jgi:hypothetical protein